MARLRGRSSPAALLLLAACGLFGPNDRDDLAAARARWDELGPSSYVLTVERQCFCLPLGPVQVTVVSSAVTERQVVSTGQPVPADQAEYYPDVPGLFQLVADALDRADAVEVQYDGQWGFPSKVVIDYAKNAIDDELTVTAGGFVAGLR